MDITGKSSRDLVGIRVARFGTILSERDGFARIKWEGSGGGETVEWLCDLIPVENTDAKEVPEVRRTWWANLLSKMSP